MLDKTRDGVLESKTFHGVRPSLRPDACCRHSMYRAFVLPAVVNRLPLRAHKEKTEGLTHPQEASPSCVTDTRTHLVLVESIGPAPAEGAVNLVGSELGESREASDQQLRCIGARRLAQETKRGSGLKIRIPKSPYGLNLNL